MPPPKLMKKHHTFDLTDMEHQQQQQQHQPSTTITANDQTSPPSLRLANNTTMNATTCQNNDFIYAADDDNDDDNAELNDNFDTTNNKTTPTTTTTTTNRNHQLQRIHSTENNNNNNNQQRQLSKLVLSSSLHQLADSKYLNNNNNNNPTTTTTTTTTTNVDNNNVAMQQCITDGDANATLNINNNNISSKPQLQPVNSIVTNHNKLPSSTTTTTTNHLINESTQTIHTTPNVEHKTTSTTTPKLKQREAKLDTVHVVVGNESCDLDSAVSCLLMFHIISKMSDEINGKDKTRTLYIPLLNTTRDMLDSKCEVLWFLQKTLNIDKSFLTCKDDIDWNEIKKNGVEVLVTLVDHNYNEEFRDIGKIVEIIDHHQVQNTQWLMENQAQIRLTLDTQVGSCTTLVAERLFYIYAEHHISDEILLLIYGTVLLDTICLSEKAKRFTRRDVYLLKKIDSLLGSKRPVRDELYKQLVEMKNSPRELNFEKLMKRDLKIYKDKHGMRVGIASLFGMGAKEALGLAANIDLDLFFRQNQYEAFIIMGLIADLEHSDSISRDLVLISANKRLFEQLCQAFEQDTSKLDLLPIGSDSSPDPEDNIINNKRIVDSSSDLSKATISAGVVTSNTNKTITAANSIDCPLPFYKARIWLQRNVTSSRKVVAPLVLKVLHDGAN